MDADGILHVKITATELKKKSAKEEKSEERIHIVRVVERLVYRLENVSVKTPSEN